MNETEATALAVTITKAVMDAVNPPPRPVGEPVTVTIAINKAEVDLTHGVIFGTASAVGVDRQGDRIEADDLERAAYAFMQKASRRATDTHGPTLPGDFVASWVEGGRWRIGFKPADIEIAKAAARGEYVGFSIGGNGIREDD